jgi:hypothetical protein
MSVFLLLGGYFEGGEDLRVVEVGRRVVETGHELVLEHVDHYALPEGEEDCDFNGEELQEGGVAVQGFVERVVEEHQVVEGVGCRDADDPADAGRDKKIGGVIFLYIAVIVSYIHLVGIYYVHKQRGSHLYNNELQHVLLTPICKILRLLPVGKLVGFLAVTERPEVVNLLLILYHYSVNLLVLHYVLASQGSTLSRS